MMVLVIGGSGSGKSAFAEETAVSLSRGEMKKYYLAAMEVRDQEDLQKIERHRKMRDGKGFLTIEQSAEIGRALERMDPGEKTILLECISSLTAGEMFSGERPGTERETAERVIGGVKLLKEEAAHLVVVTDNVFEDGVIYDEMTMRYIRAMGKINRELAVMADRVIETAAGIPITLK